MFIIFGLPRSGTTLVADTLDLHPDIVVPDETDFIVPMLLIFERIRDERSGRDIIKKIITSTDRYKTSIGHYLSESEIGEIVESANYDAATLLKSLYTAIARNSGKRIAGDKNPNDIFFTGSFMNTKVFESDIKFIHIIRDVRDVVNSLMKLHWVKNIETFFPRMWGDTNLYLHTLLKDYPGKYYLFRYEDMITDPKGVFINITDFLSVRFEEQILDHKKRGQRHIGIDHHKNIQKPFLKERAGAWKRELPKNVVKICEKQAEEALEYFRYM